MQLRDRGQFKMTDAERAEDQVRFEAAKLKKVADAEALASFTALVGTTFWNGFLTLNGRSFEDQVGNHLFSLPFEAENWTVEQFNTWLNAKFEEGAGGEE